MFLLFIVVVVFWLKCVEVEVGVDSISSVETVYVVTHGDQRQEANRLGWAAQQRLESIVQNFFSKDDVVNGKKFIIKRAHEYDPELKHGFIYSQKMGIEVFKNIPKHAKVIVAISIWCYSHHILAGLKDHEGPILLLANWSGEWPGLVGQLNLVGSLTKMGKEYSRLWTQDGKDEFFKTKFMEFIESGKIDHEKSNIYPVLSKEEICSKDDDEACNFGKENAKTLLRDKAIMCIFDEGSMGMYNAIIDDEELNDIGIFKERLSQSYLYSQMKLVGNREAYEARTWLDKKGMKFVVGEDPKTELTNSQILDQMKMYISVLRIGDSFGCDMVGIQYQQGLVHVCPASDLVEGLLNNRDRPPVFDGEKELYENEPFVHFNEVDEGAGVDAWINNRIAHSFNIDPATTLHDVRYGEEFEGEFIWVFLISGAVPPSMLIGGYEGSSSERQPTMYFPLGGGSLKGISKPGVILWSRIFVGSDRKLHAHVGTGKVRELPIKETERRWKLTTSQWPIMHAVLDGVSKNQLMANHQANHIQVIYVPEEIRDDVLKAKIVMLLDLGIQVEIVGRKDLLIN